MDIQTSLQAILQAKDALADRFYQKFLDENPEIRPIFKDVDFKRQKIMLTTALMVIERYYATPTAAVEQYLQYLGTKHDELNVPREAYKKWTTTMLDTIKEFHGKDWSQDLESQWRAAIIRACQLMYEGYDERITV